MEKILILAFDFPPKQSVGGQRPYSWFKYLPKYGLDTTVITIESTTKINTNKENINDKVFKVPIRPNLRDKFIEKYGEKYSLIRKVISFFIFYFEFNFNNFDNKRNIYLEAKKILKNNHFDIIIATGEPYILFKYAHLLSKEYEIPWVADYRDDWVEDHVRENKSFFYKYFIDSRNKILERKYMKNAAGFTTVNEDILNKISKRIKNTKGEIIFNGFDFELLKEQEKTESQSKDFVISYAGVIYEFDYFQIFEESFGMFMEKKKNPQNVKVHFYGILNNPNSVTDQVLKFKERYPNNVCIFDYLSSEVLVQKLKNSSVFLNLIAADPSKGYIGTKIYMYASLKKPILSIPIVDTEITNFFPNRNIHFVSRNILKINKLLEDNYLEFESNGYTTTDITESEIFNISREKFTNELAIFLKNILNENKRPS